MHTRSIQACDVAVEDRQKEKLLPWASSPALQQTTFIWPTERPNCFQTHPLSDWAWTATQWRGAFNIQEKYNVNLQPCWLLLMSYYNEKKFDLR